uniref:AAA+ ATPase domain-containing protein n=1 Tax=Hyalomma excavatum TaxID=257692 RepID=A0A131XH92_9ACAR
MASPRFIVLTGSPGVGKTTIVKNAVKALADQGIAVSGFYTTELREDGNRVGFDVVTIDGKRAPLARLREMCPGGKGPFVGKYCVTVQAFESIALDSLKKTHCDVLVIDEVGKMELFSKPFENQVAELISNESNCILTTVPVSTGTLCLPLVDQIKSHKCARVLNVNRSNRDRLVNEVLDIIRSAVGK